MLANIIRNSKKSVGGGGGGIVIDGGDPYYSAVSLMLSMDGTNGSTTFTDSSLNALTVTATGNAQISTTQSKYGGASGYFDGTGDYLTLTDSTQFNFGSGDWTVEFWFYNSNSADQNKCLIALNDNSNLYAGIRVYYNSSNALDTLISATGTSWSVISNNASANSVTKNAWHHYAIVRTGSTLKTFLNGVQYMTDKTISGSVFSSSTHLVAAVRNGGTAIDTFNGYIDDLRISRFARYVSNFTPPTAALPTYQSSTVADPYYNYTSLLLHMDGANASTNFVDSGPNALAVTAVGNAQVSTAQSKYGAASGYFDGSGDYLTTPANSIVLGSGDWTIEFWLFLNNSVASNLIDQRNTGSQLAPSIYYNGSSIRYLTLGADRIIGPSLPLNQWHHIAVVKASSQTKMYVNGTQTGSTYADSNNYIGPNFAIGAYQPLGNTPPNGYIDDLRITKGVARYTSAFTPPASAFPNA
jgi:hypothetical protein